MMLASLILVAVGLQVGTAQADADPMLVARCQALCWDQTAAKQHCVETCLGQGFLKPGTCPESLDNVFAGACLEACSNDTQCTDITKCCSHSCGITCQAPQDLHTVIGLPKIPEKVNVDERRGVKGEARSVILEWMVEDTKEGVVFVVEWRHHMGRMLTWDRLTDWAPLQHHTTRYHVTLKHLLKPGAWYQFRVAAVNANGTRGFSVPSQPFTLSQAVRAPGKPGKLSVRCVSIVDGVVAAELSWKLPKSDLPLSRYKVFWSRKLQKESDQSPVIVRQITLPQDKTRFSLEKLEPDTLYFLQVQALAQYGSKRLKGEKEAIFLNTTNCKTNASVATPVAILDRKKLGRLRVKVTSMEWIQDGVVAKLAWQGLGMARYTLSWKSPCQEHTLRAATTWGSHYDIIGLSVDCKYNVNVKELMNGIVKRIGNVSFTTPHCKQLNSEAICS